MSARDLAGERRPDLLACGEVPLLDTTGVDDTWSAGYVGLYRAAINLAAQQFDDVTIAYGEQLGCWVGSAAV